MNREDAKQEIKSSWQSILQQMTGKAKRKVNGAPTYICPLCQNGTGSTGDGIALNPKGRDGNSLHCFKCGFSGDIIDLYREQTGTDYNTALPLLADMIGVTIDAYSPDAGRQREPQRPEPTTADAKQSAQDVQEVQQESKADYRAYYQECRARLTEPQAVAYLKSRGISIETAAAYYLGFDAEWKSPTACKSGKNPPASPRLIIPTSATHYIARDTRQDLTDRQKPFAKMNEGSPAIFNEQILFTQDVQEVFVTEGAFDALSIIEAGAPAIALNSTSNADALLIDLERRRTDATLILCLDNDDAGRQTTDRLRAGLDRLNISHITADVCGEHNDPNEHATADAAGFTAAVLSAKAQASTRPDSVANYIDSLMQKDIEKQKVNVATGFDNLDKEAGGLYSGLYILAAISSLGKTTFAHQMADNIAKNGTDVIFFSLEQSRLEMVSKSLARTTAKTMGAGNAVSSLAIRKGFAPTAVNDALAEYKETIAPRLSIVEGNFDCNITFIGDYIRHYIEKTHCRPVVFVDYLQILQPTANAGRQTTKEIVEATTTELKKLSRALSIPIIAISSVNRANYLTPIDFESLKESGGIEYTADVVWGLQLQILQSEHYEKTSEITKKRKMVKDAKAETPRKIELVCLKNRYGISSYSCFYDYYPAADYFTEGADPDNRARIEPPIISSNWIK